MLSSQGGNVSTPGLQTMAEKQRSAGIDPNAAYRPGSAQDPYASGLSGVTAAQRVAGSNATAAALAPNQQAPQIENQMDTTSSRQRRQTRTPGLKDGGAVYRNGDTFSDRPMTGVVGSVSRDPVATAPKPVQQIARPIYPQERQAAPQEQEQRGQGMTSAADLGAMLAERRKQISQHSGMADGGMVRHRFDGKGGPRDDQIPVTVAGEKIKVSDGEEAVILPAKTAKSPQAIAQIASAIQQSNDGRPPAMGMAQGGRYAGGAMPHIVDPSGQVYVNGRPAGYLPPPPDPVRTNFTVDSSGTARGANLPGTAVGPYRGPGTAVAQYVPSAQPRPYDVPKAAPRGMAFEAGKAAGSAYKNVGGMSGAVGKLANIAVPVIAAAQTFGDNGIRVEGNRAADPNYDETAGFPRVASTLKEAALRAGDWGTKGLDVLGGWALPAGEASFNDAYRQGVGQLEGVYAPTSQQIAARSEVGNAPYSNEGRQSAILNSNTTPNPQIARNTGNANGATFDPATGNLYFTEKGYDPTKQTMAAGTGAITDPKTGRTIMITGAGVPENPNAPRDQYGNDMTQTLQARDALMRQRQENALSMMNSPLAGYREAGQAQMRGLSDVSALDTAATRRAGDQQQQAANVPEMDRKLKGQQIAQGGMAMQQAQRLNDAADAVKNAKTAEEQAAAIATWRALNPKSDDKRFIPQTAKTYDNGMPTGEEVRMFDTQTQRWLSPDSPAAIPEASKRKIGQVYDTPKGKMVWRGNGWEAA
ncbi:MAG: hypothetical protein IPJ57_20385 [Gemmatimonadetes bacterium]|nr:hypothetical protein [Gemmatimonadota bacterium]